MITDLKKFDKPLSPIKSWSNCDFRIGATTMEVIPETSLNEIAFAGRSNVGKSSLINAITGRNSLARVSKNPGCTSQLNFFDIEDKIFLVDMPGYGYAKISKEDKLNWGDLINKYLAGRPYLKRVFLLIDSRQGFKDVDKITMDLMDTFAVNYKIIFTKCDKISEQEQKNLAKSFQAVSKKHPAMHPEFIFTSSEKKIGIDEVRDDIISLI